jgi:DNA helicase II / ATP-dependent DNA helicase PcrA
MPERHAWAGSRLALDERQAEAVLAPPGPLLVLAGAGSGKTRVLTERAAAIVANRGQPAEALLLITFTNKAADELRERLERLIGEADGRMTIGTFHALGHRLLRAHARRVGRSPRFSIYDGHAGRRLISGALEELRAGESLAVRLVALQIGQAKARLIDPDGYRALRDNDLTRLIASAYERYERALERSDALDLDDLIGRTVALLGEPDLAARYQQRWRTILVDEHQDTNPAQHELVRRLAAGHRNLTVAGDDDQAIYRFRGAEVQNLLGFERDFPGARAVALVRNYRSSGAIVAAAARLAAHNTRRRAKTMWTLAPAGPPVRLHACADECEEADAAAHWCAGHLDRGAEPGALAVLVRTRAQLRPLEDALLLAGIGCRVVGGQGLWETAAVRDLVAHVTLLVNPRDEVALGRALRTRPGVGAVSVARVLGAGRGGGDLVAACRAAGEILGLRGRQRLAVEAFGRGLTELAWTAERDGVAAACTEVALASGLVERLARERSEHAEEQLERLRRFCRGAHAYQAQTERPSLADFLAQAALRSADDEDEPAGLVTLSTVHAAKGCEWDHVLIVGLCEGLLPHEHALRRGEVDEERRLAYVGMTRARHELALSWPRVLRGRPVQASRFLAEAGLGPAQPKAPALRRAA